MLGERLSLPHHGCAEDGTREKLDARRVLTGRTRDRVNRTEGAKGADVPECSTGGSVDPIPEDDVLAMEDVVHKGKAEDLMTATDVDAGPATKQ